MGRKRGGKRKDQKGIELKSESDLQAVVLADSFTQKLRPLTFEKPKVLLPLVNVPMLSYILEFLTSGGVKEIFVVCTSHAEQVQAFLSSSGWLARLELKVQAVVAPDAASAGDALRHMDSLDVLKGTFVLVSGDVVSTFKLDEVLKAHKERYQKDKRNFMTMVFKRAAPRHRTRAVADDLVVAVDKTTGQLLSYENMLSQKYASLDKELFEAHRSIMLAHDWMDTHIDICSSEVLYKITDNFDYQDLRRDFVRGILGDEIYGNKIFTHVLEKEYAARVMDLHAYNSISLDIVHRWTHPLVPENNLVCPETFYQISRNHVYKEQTPPISLARSCKLGIGTVVGGGTSIGERTTLNHAIVGRNCTIGSDCVLEHCYVWDSCTIADRVVLKHCLLANNVVIGKCCEVKKGAVLAFGVHIAENHTVECYQSITALPPAKEVAFGEQQPEEVPEAGETQGAVISKRSCLQRARKRCVTLLWWERAALEGKKRRGTALKRNRLFVEEADEEDSDSDEEENVNKWLNERHCSSLAPDKNFFTECEKKVEEWGNELSEFEDEEKEDLTIEPHHKSVTKPCGCTEVINRAEANTATFFSELKDTLRRGHLQNLAVDAVELECGALKLAHDAEPIGSFVRLHKTEVWTDYARGVFITLFSLLDPQPVAAKEEEWVKPTEAVLFSLKALIQKWKSTIGKFGRSQRDQELILEGLQNAFEGPSAASLTLYALLFGYTLQFLYEMEICGEEALLEWEKNIDQSSLSPVQARLFATATRLLEWLKEESEEEEESEEDTD